MMRDPSKRRVVILVLATHFLFLVYMSLSPTLPVKKTAKPLIVKTITPKAASPKEHTPSPRKAPTVASAKPSKEIAKKEKEPPSLEKKKAEKLPPIADKKIVKGKKESAAKKPVEETREKMSKKLLQELEESLSKLDEKPQKKSAPSKGGVKSQHAPLILQLDSNASADEAAVYDNTLIGYLKQALNLPEYGEVKIQLTLKQDGSFVNLVVIKAESEKNRKYLEASLPHLRFPHLAGKKKQETFIVTFCNEI